MTTTMFLLPYKMCHETLEKKDQSTLTFIVANLPPPPFLTESSLTLWEERGWLEKGEIGKVCLFRESARESALDFATADFFRKSRSRVSRAATSFYFPGCMCSPSSAFVHRPGRVVRQIRKVWTSLPLPLSWKLGPNLILFLPVQPPPPSFPRNEQKKVS